jgi:hypothetical protein
VTIGLRHRCRLCRTTLKEPTDNPRRAFCCRGCFQSFYRSRCVVCAVPIRRKNEQQKTCIKKACKDELRRFPLAFAWQKTGNTPSDYKRASETLDFSGSKTLIEGDRPPFRCVANWCWDGDPGAGDHSLYDADGLTLARIVRERDGRSHLRSPLTWPHLSWGVDQAKRRAESLALASLPVDPKTAQRIERDNQGPHPMSRPLERPPTLTDDTTTTRLAFKERGSWSDDLEIPTFLTRTRRCRTCPKT